MCEERDKIIKSQDWREWQTMPDMLDDFLYKNDLLLEDHNFLYRAKVLLEEYINKEVE